MVCKQVINATMSWEELIRLNAPFLLEESQAAAEDVDAGLEENVKKSLLNTADKTDFARQFCLEIQEGSDEGLAGRASPLNLFSLSLPTNLLPLDLDITPIVFADQGQKETTVPIAQTLVATQHEQEAQQDSLLENSEAVAEDKDSVEFSDGEQDQKEVSTQGRRTRGIKHCYKEAESDGETSIAEEGDGEAVIVSLHAGTIKKSSKERKKYKWTEEKRQLLIEIAQKYFINNRYCWKKAEGELTKTFPEMTIIALKKFHFAIVSPNAVRKKDVNRVKKPKHLWTEEENKKLIQIFEKKVSTKGAKCALKKEITKAFGKERTYVACIVHFSELKKLKNQVKET